MENSNEMRTFGSVIRQARKGKGLSMENVARKLGVTRAYINLVEKDKCGMTFENIGKLADALGLDSNGLIELQDKRQGEETPGWLRYIVGKYAPSQYVIDTMKKLIASSGLEWEDKEGERSARWKMEEKWDAFYGFVKKMLDDFNLKVFSDDRVRSSLRNLNLTEECGWQALKERVEKEIHTLCICPESEDYGAWRNSVARALEIKEVTLDGAGLSELMLKALSSGAAKDALAGMTIIASSKNLYGAVYKASEFGDGYRKFCYIEDRQGAKAKMKDFAFWHCLARIILDPELKFGREMKDDSEKYEFDAYRYLLSRVAAWIALMPIREKLRFSRDIYDKARDLAEKVMPKDYAIMGLLDNMITPVIYAKCRMRERTDCPEESTRLRAEMTFRNLAASNLKGDVRYNMAVSEGSVIKKAFDERKSYVCKATDLSLQWDKHYRIKGEINELIAIYDEGENCVHAFLDMKAQ